MLHVVSVHVLPNYHLRLRFSDGVEGIADLTGELYGVMFAPLRDALMFASAQIDEELGTVAWDNGADLAPEFLRELVHAHDAMRPSN